MEPLNPFMDVAAPYAAQRLDPSIAVAWIMVGLGPPILGYVFLVLDIRRYLRSLRRALVVIVQAPTTIPYWVLRERPPCLQTFGLDAHASEEQLWAAYREQVKDAHPDRGGSLQDFLRLQKHFDQALHLIRQRAARSRTQ